MKCIALLFSLSLLSVPAGSLSCSTSCSQLIRYRDARCTIPSDYSVVYDPCEPEPADNASTCDARVGLNLTVECSDDDAVLHWDGKPIGNQSALVIHFVRPEHRGVYDCRSANDTVLAQRLLIVNKETQVAGGPRGTCIPFKCLEEFECCNPFDYQSIEQVGQELFFNVYGDDPEVSWETVQWRNHQGVDLKLQLITNSLTSVQSLVIGQRPRVVGTGTSEFEPIALVRVTASNNFSTSSACFNLSFFGGPTLFTNGSLPANETVEEGRDAVFECIMGAYFLTEFSTSGVRIQYEQNGTVDPWLCQRFECTCGGSCRSEITWKVNSALQFIEYSYEIRVPSVATAESGAVVSCALLYNNVTQWKREATLTVVQATLLTTPTGTSPGGSSLNQDALTAGIVGGLVLMLTVTIALVLWTVIVRRKKYRFAQSLYEDVAPYVQLYNVTTNCAYTRSTIASTTQQTETSHGFSDSVENGRLHEESDTRIDSTSRSTNNEEIYSHCRGVVCQEESCIDSNEATEEDHEQQQASEAYDHVQASGPYDRVQDYERQQASGPYEWVQDYEQQQASSPYDLLQDYERQQASGPYDQVQDYEQQPASGPYDLLQDYERQQASGPYDQVQDYERRQASGPYDLLQDYEQLLISDTQDRVQDYEQQQHPASGTYDQAQDYEQQPASDPQEQVNEVQDHEQQQANEVQDNEQPASGPAHVC